MPCHSGPAAPEELSASTFPPTELPVGSLALYVGLVVGGTVVFTGLPLLIGMMKQSSWRALNAPTGAVTKAA